MVAPDNLEFVPCSEDNVLAIVQDRVALDYLFRTKGLLYLSVHIFHCVFHEDCRVRNRLGHLLLSLHQSADHSVRNDNRLVAFRISHLDC